MGWMLPPPLSGPMTPEHWLNIATHGLARAAAARVRAEYLAHLEDALDAGESASDVLREWGDPHRANRELSLAHLTAREARYLPAGYAPSWAGLGKALGEDAAVLAVWVYRAVQDTVQGELSAAVFGLLGLTLCAIVLRWLALSRRAFSPQARALLHWLLSPVSLALLLIVGLLTWEGGWSGVAEEIGRGEWPMLLALSYALYHFSRLLTALSAARKAEAQAA